MGTGPSSLHISKSNHTAEIGWRVDSTCDGCAGENGALCIKYCHLGAIRLNGAGPPKGAPAPPDGPATRFGGPTTWPETAT
jgi:hypothetical protein